MHGSKAIVSLAGKPVNEWFIPWVYVCGGVLVRQVGR
jgi:hypothetical protein